jgi:O-6-methylguanine DNA methyltransferase
MQPAIHRPQAEIWDIRWMTPIGVMQGTLTASGWRSLSFPPPERRTLPASARAGSQLLSACSRIAPESAPGGAVDAQLKTMQCFLFDYFEGKPPAARPAVAAAGSSPFTSEIRRLTADIPFGQTRSYGELAQQAGHPGAARAVGRIMARNPLVLLIPCHRVLATSHNGCRRLGGFTGGLELKRWLLELESTTFRSA